MCYAKMGESVGASSSWLPFTGIVGLALEGFNCLAIISGSKVKASILRIKIIENIIIAFCNFLRFLNMLCEIIY